MAKLVLIDALNLIRRIFAVDLDNNSLNEEQTLLSCYERVKSAAQKILNTLSATHAVAVFDGDKSWRYHYYAQYKHSRKPMPSLLSENLEYISQAFIDIGIVCFQPDNDEADDVIATLAEKASANKITSTIVSTDKGFLPHISEYIQVYDYFKKLYIDDEQIHSRFSLPKSHLIEFWSMCGDKTNDIPGVRGIGKKTAIEIIQHYGSVENAIASSELKPSIRKKLESDTQSYITSKALVTLRVDIELGFSLKELRVQAI